MGTCSQQKVRYPSIDPKALIFDLQFDYDGKRGVCFEGNRTAVSRPFCGLPEAFILCLDRLHPLRETRDAIAAWKIGFGEALLCVGNRAVQVVLVGRNLAVVVCLAREGGEDILEPRLLLVFHAYRKELAQEIVLPMLESVVREQASLHVVPSHELEAAVALALTFFRARRSPRRSRVSSCEAGKD